MLNDSIHLNLQAPALPTTFYIAYLLYLWNFKA